MSIETPVAGDDDGWRVAGSHAEAYRLTLSVVTIATWDVSFLQAAHGMAASPLLDLGSARFSILAAIAHHRTSSEGDLANNLIGPGSSLTGPARQQGSSAATVVHRPRRILDQVRGCDGAWLCTYLISDSVICRMGSKLQCSHSMFPCSVIGGP
jgi:hypothetical protein